MVEKFSDDYRVARAISKPDDHLDLQKALVGLVDWCDLNRMFLNVDKCCVITFHRKKQPQIYDYAINAHNLSRVNQVKDLGVFLDHNLKFNTHYQKIIRKG